MNRSQEITLGMLLDARLKPVFDTLRIASLRRQMKNTTNDIALSEKRITNSQAVVSHEETHIKKCHTAQALIQSELLELGAPWADEESDTSHSK